MQHNIGKTLNHQKTVSDLISTSFAYQDIEPCYEVPRQTLLNPRYDGSSKLKLGVQNVTCKKLK